MLFAFYIMNGKECTVSSTVLWRSDALTAYFKGKSEMNIYCSYELLWKCNVIGSRFKPWLGAMHF